MVEHIDVHVNDGMTTQEIAAVDDAREALNQLAKTWDHWKRVGNALKVGREFCIRVTNRPPTDTDYKLRFSRWLLYNGFRDEIISKWDRASLLKLMDNLPAVEHWRQTLTEAQRNSWNNPLRLLQRWTESGEVYSIAALLDHCIENLNAIIKNPDMPLGGTPNMIKEQFNQIDALWPQVKQALRERGM